MKQKLLSAFDDNQGKGSFGQGDEGKHSFDNCEDENYVVFDDHVDMSTRAELIRNKQNIIYCNPILSSLVTS